MSQTPKGVVDSLKGRNVSKATKQDACNSVRILSNSDKINQGLLAEAGVIPYLAKIFIDENDLRDDSCKAIQTLCFSNEPNSLAFAREPNFLPNVLRGIAEGEMTKRLATGSMFRNIAANSWDAHLTFDPIVAKACEILLDDQQNERILTECDRYINALVGILVVISYNSNARPMLLKYRADDCLIYLMRKENDTCDIESVACAIGVANLVGDQDNHPALDITNSEYLLTQILTCCRATLRGEYYPPHRKVRFTLWRLAMGIANLCKSDSNKSELVKMGILPILYETLVKDGDERQAQYALEGIWHVSFNTSAQDEIRKNEGLMGRIDTFAKSTDEKLASTRKSAKGILWNLGIKDESEQQLLSARGKPDAKKLHIMLSYCWADQTKIVQLSTELKNAGFLVWIDVDQMHGSTLEAMAEAIEGSWVVVCGVSQAYKNSAACRVEGEYAFTAKKPVIPVLVQQGYRATGWLGALLGSKLWYDITTDAVWSASLSNLMRELRKLEISLGVPPSTPLPSQLTNQTVPTTATNSSMPLSNPSQHFPSSDKALAMSLDDVSGWLESSGLGDVAVIDAFRNAQFDGPALVGLYRLSRNHPEVLTSATKELGLSLGSGFKFAHRLGELCNQ